MMKDRKFRVGMAHIHPTFIIGEIGYFLKLRALVIQFGEGMAPEGEPVCLDGSDSRQSALGSVWGNRSRNRLA